MRFLESPRRLGWTVASVAMAIAVVVGCQISPRRIVIGGNSPTPTPTETPTPGFPTPTPTPTPTPGFATPTPTGMSTRVPKTGDSPQFLFVASSDSPMILGFSISEDGSLAPVPGSPFPEESPLHAIATLDGSLIVADANRLRVFAVDRETGSIQPTDSLGFKDISRLATDPSGESIFATMPTGMIALRVAKGKLEPALPSAALPISATPSQAVLDASGKFMYEVDSAKAELRAFRIHGKTVVPLSPASYPLPAGSSSIALVTAQTQR